MKTSKRGLPAKWFALGWVDVVDSLQTVVFSTTIEGQAMGSRFNQSAKLGQLHQIYWNHIQSHGAWWTNWNVQTWVLNKHNDQTDGDGKQNSTENNHDLRCPTPARLNPRVIFQTLTLKKTFKRDLHDLRDTDDWMTTSELQESKQLH